MYPSDYGYATSGGSTTDRAACLAESLFTWNEVSDCMLNDYLYKSGYYEWTLVPSSLKSNYVFEVAKTYGYVVDYYVTGIGGDSARPVAFLKSNISIANVGMGTAESPFQLKVG